MKLTPHPRRARSVHARHHPNCGGDQSQAGQAGEHLAACYLEDQGYQVLARNWRDPRGELDLVVRRGAELVIVEVRATQGGERYAPEQTVHRAKQAHVIGAARRWLRRAGLEGAPLCVRFDVIGVRLHTGEVVHLRGAFEAP